MPELPNKSNPSPSIDELTAEVPNLASSRNLVLIRALPVRGGESSFAVYLSDEDMSATEFCDTAAAVGTKILYFEVHNFNAEDDLTMGRRGRLNRRADTEDPALTALRHGASGRRGRSLG
jgi:hypothetical protein